MIFQVVVLGAKKLETGKEVRVVLPEEKYLGRLQEIIVRDYFPELPKLKVCSSPFLTSNKGLYSLQKIVKTCSFKFV